MHASYLESPTGPVGRSENPGEGASFHSRTLKGEVFAYISTGIWEG